MEVLHLVWDRSAGLTLRFAAGSSAMEAEQLDALTSFAALVTPEWALTHVPKPYSSSHVPSSVRE